MAKKYKISEVGEMLGISPSAIRFYEKKGLFKAEKDSVNGYRTFDQKDIKKIWSIAYHRNIDMSLETINHLKHTEALPEIKAIVAQEKDKAQERIAHEEKMVKILNFYLATLDSVEEHLDKFSRVDTEPLHLFHCEYLYKPGTDVCTMGYPITVFNRDESVDYIAVHHRFMDLVSPDEAAEEIKTIPSFPGLYSIVQRRGDIDEKAVVEMVLAKAAALNYKVQPPYYVQYLISAGEWTEAQRFYEVILTPALE